MRIPYVPNPPSPASPEDEAIVHRIEQRRHPRPLQPLDLALLHAPAVADGWNTFVGNVRTKTSIGDDLRELAISRIAVINHAGYEWMHHAPLAIKAGVPEETVEFLKTKAPLAKDERLGSFTDVQWAVLVMTDEMTRSVVVADDTFAWVKQLLTEKEVVEIVATIACYNCVSRFLVALDVGERNGAPMARFCS
jgi:alkylhydroperoxidase family enzyme